MNSHLLVDYMPRGLRDNIHHGVSSIPTLCSDKNDQASVLRRSVAWSTAITRPGVGSARWRRVTEEISVGTDIAGIACRCCREISPLPRIPLPQVLRIPTIAFPSPGSLPWKYRYGRWTVGHIVLSWSSTFSITRSEARSRPTISCTISKRNPVSASCRVVVQGTMIAIDGDVGFSASHGFFLK